MKDFGMMTKEKARVSILMPTKIFTLATFKMENLTELEFTVGTQKMMVLKDLGTTVGINKAKDMDLGYLNGLTEDSIQENGKTTK